MNSAGSVSNAFFSCATLVRHLNEVVVVNLFMCMIKAFVNLTLFRFSCSGNKKETLHTIQGITRLQLLLIHPQSN